MIVIVKIIISELRMFFPKSNDEFLLKKKLFLSHFL